MNRLCAFASVLLFVVVVPLDVRAENENMTNATAILRQSIGQLQKAGCRNPITPEVAPRSYYSCPVDGPKFEARCSEVNGRFRYRCSYQMDPAPECSWSERVRKIGIMRIYSAFDREPAWQLLARSPATYSFEEVLTTLGRSYRSHMLSCSQCDKKDMRWEYAIVGADDYGVPIRHTLTFSFASNGRCTGWVWLAEPQVSAETVLRR